MRLGCDKKTWHTDKYNSCGLASISTSNLKYNFKGAFYTNTFNVVLDILTGSSPIDSVPEDVNIQHEQQGLKHKIYTVLTSFLPIFLYKLN